MTQAILEHGGSAQGHRGPSLRNAAIQAFARYRARRRTKRELAKLDDRILADIGLSRADIDLAAAVATGTLPRRESPWRRLAARVSELRARARTIEDMNRMSDHILNDIGVQRWQIAEAVDGIMYRNAHAPRVSPQAGSRVSPQAGPRAAPQAVPSAMLPVHGLMARLELAILPMRQWQISRIAAGQLARFDRGTLADLGYVKGDVDWVPEVMASRHLNPAANGNRPRKGVA